MRRGHLAVVVLVLLIPFTVSGALGKSSDDLPLSELLTSKFSPSNPLVLANTGHAAHFVSQPEATATIQLLNQGIATQLATLPLGSSSGGFTYTFNPSLGIYDRSAETFGPLFAERAITAGKGKVNVGFNYLHSQYDEFEGIDLRGGQFLVNLIHSDINHDGTTTDLWFEGDYITANYHINLKSQTFAFFANYGVTDNIDVGVAVPVTKLQMDVAIDEQIHDVATHGDPFISHTFDPNCDVSVDPNSCMTRVNHHVDYLSDSASGIGDVILRTKVGIRSGKNGAMAAGVDLRLPTGDEKNLLGAGATQTKLYLIFSGPATKFSPHANIGYTFVSGSSPAIGDVANEMDYTAGFDAALHRRLSVNVDLLGRTLFGVNRLVEQQHEFVFTEGNGGPVKSTFGPEFVAQQGDLSQLLGAAGIKWNVAGNLLLNVNGLFALGNQGLQDHFTGVFGIDYSF